MAPFLLHRFLGGWQMPNTITRWMRLEMPQLNPQRTVHAALVAFRGARRPNHGKPSQRQADFLRLLAFGAVSWLPFVMVCALLG